MADNNSILIVEDDDDTRNMVRLILEEKNYNVKDCAGGKEALEWLKDNKPALILLDIMMPEMNGYEVLEALKKVDKLKNIPVIMLTAKNTGDDIISGYQHGADYYIPKPFTTEQLVFGIQLFIN